MEDSIADVATHDEGALDFAGDLAKRVLTIMDIAVELGLAETDGINANRHRLLDVGVSEEAIDNRTEGFLRELKQNSMRTKTISESGVREGVEKGNAIESGFVGFSPLAIKNATGGSLRERMYIPFISREHAVMAFPKNKKIILGVIELDIFNNATSQKKVNDSINKEQLPIREEVPAEPLSTSKIGRQGSVDIESKLYKICV